MSRMAFTLNPGKILKEIDVTALAGPQKGKMGLGEYELKDGRLKVCLQDREAATKGRPAMFGAEKGLFIMSRSVRWTVIGTAVLCLGVFGAGLVLPHLLIWRAFNVPPPTAPEPAEYTAYEATLDGSCLMIRNTGPDALAVCRVHYRVARNDAGTSWYDGNEEFLEWRPGEDVVIPLPTDVRRGRLVQFTGTASKGLLGPQCRFRYGPSAPRSDNRLDQDVGFDPDLAAATSERPKPKP